MGGRGGERKQGNTLQEASNVGNLQIGGTKIVPPLRNAMRLIHHQQADIHSLQLRDKDIGRKALGGDIKEFIIAKDTVLKRGDDLVARHAGIYCGRLYTTLPQVIHLVFHQRYERRYHQTDPFHAHDGYLKSKRLTPAGRHQPQCIPPLPYRLDDLLLQRPERGIPPIVIQYLVKQFRLHRQALARSSPYIFDHELSERLPPMGVFLNGITDIHRLA